MSKIGVGWEKKIAQNWELEQYYEKSQNPGFQGGFLLRGD